MPPQTAAVDRPPAASARRSPRVLILSASFGGGHESAARALRSWWEREVEPGGLKILDHYAEFVSPITTGAASFGYTQSVRLFPAGYRAFYEATRHLRADSSAQRWLNSLGKRELGEYIQRYQPDIIVSVHPTPAGALAELRLAGELHLPTVTVVTDYVIHNQWVHKGTDLYLVGSDEVKQGMVELGVEPERVRATGIPVHVDTRLLDQREALREKWQLEPDIPVLLVMTGAQGMLRRPWQLFHTLASRPVQGFFLCGRDTALLARLKMYARRYPRFRVLPFVRVVPELMCVADLLVSKAGGLTVSEAMAMELPVLVFRPIPGQEHANRDFLVQHGAAMSASSLVELGRQLDRVCANPELLQGMRRAMRLIRKPDAAADAGRAILELARVKG